MLSFYQDEPGPNLQESVYNTDLVRDGASSTLFPVHREPLQEPPNNHDCVDQASQVTLIDTTAQFSPPKAISTPSNEGDFTIASLQSQSISPAGPSTDSQSVSPKVPEPQAGRKGSCQCLHCDKVFPKMSVLRRHARTHDRSLQLQCNDCGRQMLSTRLLQFLLFWISYFSFRIFSFPKKRGFIMRLIISEFLAGYNS